MFFRVRCSDRDRSPRFLRYESSIEAGVSSFYAEVVLPDANPASYAWNVTDCLGSPLFEGTGVTRDRLFFDRTRGQDTIRIVGSVPLPDGAAGIESACTALIVMDRAGNTTGWGEERRGNEEGDPPDVTGFNVVLDGDSLTTRISATDPDGDLAGVFMTARFADGTLGQGTDGRPDEGIYNVAGYLPPFEIPPLRIGNIPIAKVLSVSADVIDRAGNRTRVTDTDFFR